MNSISHKLKRLPPHQWLGLLAAYYWLACARWKMRHLSGPGWLTARQASQRPSTKPINWDWVAQRVRLVSIAARYPFRWSLCLQSSLALQDWLNQGGVYPDLRIGVNKGGRRFAAHAWLELDGRVLNDRPRVARRFAPMDLASITSTELVETE